MPPPGPSVVTRSPPQTCAAGFVFALEIEAEAFAARIRDTRTLRGPSLTFHEGSLAGRRVAWVVAGAGVEAARVAASALVIGHTPATLVSAGFAGGLAPDMARGAVVSPTRSLRAGQAPIPLAPVPPSAGARAGGDIVTVDAVVTTAAAKRSLHAATGAAIVDMETSAVAAVAAAAGIPCASVRIVSDAADDELPADIARLVAPQSAFRRAGAAFAAIGRKPAALGTLWRLWENAVVDGRALAGALERIVGSLPAN